MLDLQCTTNTSIVCKYGQSTSSAVGSLKAYDNKKKLVASTAVDPSGAIDKNIDFRKRVQLGAWKPTNASDRSNQHTLALVFRNCIYLYHDKEAQKLALRR